MEHKVIILFALLYTIVSVIIYGKLLDKLAYSRLIEKVGSFLMLYSKAPKFKIQVVFCWFAYLATGLLLSVAAILLFQDNIGKLYFGFQLSYLPILFYGFIAQITLSCTSLLVIKAFHPTLQWDKVIGNVEWVRVSRQFSSVIRIIYPMSSSFCEELLFRGVLYGIFKELFKEQGILLPIIIVAIAFSMEQILNTQTLIQAIGLMIGSLFVSVVGCIMIEVTGSVLPAILSHMMFAMFYTKGYNM